MKFKVGDKIKIYKPFLRMGRNHVGSIGVVTELRSYAVKRLYGEAFPTHYVVKFDCYKVPHIFMKYDIEETCELVNQ